MVLILQGNFYNNEVGKWKGKPVSNTFTPPVGSGPIFRALKGLIKSQLLPYPFPVVMTFAVTYRCQCKCVHCSAVNHIKEDQKELNTRETKKLIDEAQKLGVTIIAFTGEEPLLRKDIFELISHVNPKKAMSIMFTNGQFLTEENVNKLVKAGVYSLFVSIGGCLAANIQFYVSAYGDVTPCDFTPLSFGNVRKEPLKNIWMRMVKHPAYNHESPFCRMQDPKFRKCYIEPIPEDAILPYEISHLPCKDYRNL
ncbi:MAG: radical SAM/SPASM domain-containing protein [Promethearchaeota archaeon]